MKITPDTLVSEILEARPDAANIFSKYGVEVNMECHSVLDNPLDLCETMCSIRDFDTFLKELQVFMDTPPERR